MTRQASETAPVPKMLQPLLLLLLLLLLLVAERPVRTAKWCCAGSQPGDPICWFHVELQTASRHRLGS